MKSSFSNGNGGNNCVDVVPSVAGGVWIAHSKHTTNPQHFTKEEWWAFIDGVKAGEFDGLVPRD